MSEEWPASTGAEDFRPRSADRSAKAPCCDGGGTPPIGDESTDASYDAVASVLADDVASGILRESYVDARSAQELTEAVGVSQPTVYRRLQTLRDLDLVVTATRPDPDGHHTDVYRANVDRVVVDLDGDGFSVDVRRRETRADRFTRIIEDM